MVRGDEAMSCGDTKSDDWEVEKMTEADMKLQNRKSGETGDK